LGSKAKALHLLWKLHQAGSMGDFDIAKQIVNQLTNEHLLHQAKEKSNRQ
jgi:hypothetical protein